MALNLISNRISSAKDNGYDIELDNLEFNKIFNKYKLIIIDSSIFGGYKCLEAYDSIPDDEKNQIRELIRIQGERLELIAKLLEKKKPTILISEETLKEYSKSLNSSINSSFIKWGLGKMITIRSNLFNKLNNNNFFLENYIDSIGMDPNQILAKVCVRGENVNDKKSGYLV